MDARRDELLVLPFSGIRSTFLDRRGSICVPSETYAYWWSSRYDIVIVKEETISDIGECDEAVCKGYDFRRGWGGGL